MGTLTYPWDAWRVSHVQGWTLRAIGAEHGWAAKRAHVAVERVQVHEPGHPVHEVLGEENGGGDRNINKQTINKQQTNN